jgi:hypothetical protein
MNYKKMTKVRSKLEISKESLRRLSMRDLKRVDGGVPSDETICSAPYCSGHLTCKLCP